MIIKILSSTGTFAAVRYNTNKVDSGDGELMKIGNMRHFENDPNISPEEVKEYMVAHSAVNPRIKNAQFHATISAKGKELDKHQLTEAAVKYLDKMGYGENPYIIVFHSDTENNHVHIVSSRVGNDGKKINNDNEKYRSQSVRRELMKEYGIKTDKDIDMLLSYRFQTEKQLLTLLRNEGFTVVEDAGSLDVYHNGNLRKKLDRSAMRYGEPDRERARQLKAIVQKYAEKHDTKLVPVFEKRAGERLGKITGYTSELSEFLKSRFGLEFHYHFSGDKKPFGYTVFDHSEKKVFKGSDIFKLAMLLDGRAESKQKERQVGRNRLLEKVSAYNISNIVHLQVLAKHYKIPEYQMSLNDRKLTDAERNYYGVLLDHHFKNGGWNDIEKLGITPVKHNGELLLLDRDNLTVIDAREFLPLEMLEAYSFQHPERDFYPENQQTQGLEWGWSMADDVDDERAFGRERNRGNAGRKRK